MCCFVAFVGALHFLISARAGGGVFFGVNAGERVRCSLGGYGVASIRIWDELSLRGRSVCMLTCWLQSHPGGE